MRRPARVLIAALACLAAQIASGCRNGKSASLQPATDPRHEVVLRAPGTLVSIEERAHDEQSEDLLPGPRVCYTIDSFAAVPIAERGAYESAERARHAAQGPRCHDTAVDPSAVRLKVGDRVEIYLTLEAGNQISVVKITAHGVAL